MKNSKPLYKWRKGHSTLLNPEKYERFIASHIFTQNPVYYSIIRSIKINTVDGEMFLMSLSEDIVDPNIPPIAKCTINNREYFWWNDVVWGVAARENGDLLNSVNCGMMGAGPNVFVIYRLNQLEDDDGN